MDKLSLFARPTQMGKSTLFSLAEKVYSKTETASDAAKIIPENRRNAGYVLRFNFLEVTCAMTPSTWQENLRRIDLALLGYIKSTVSRYTRFYHQELEPFFTEPDAAERAQAEDYLQCLANAIADYSRSNRTSEFFSQA